MAKGRSKIDLISDAIRKNKELGKPLEVMGEKGQKKQLDFLDLDIDSIKPKKDHVEYASVKLKTELYQKIKKVALKQGIKQPGKFIGLILETYLKQTGA